MTGRRLYDLVCDAWAGQGTWATPRGVVLPETPVAWAFLTQAERRAFSRAAAKATPKPRKVAS